MPRILLQTLCKPQIKILAKVKGQETETLMSFSLAYVMVIFRKVLVAISINFKNDLSISNETLHNFL